MNPILFWYLVLSGVAMLYMAIRLAWEDYDMRYINTWKRSTAKFGYNYSRKGLWWLMIGGCAPGINLFVLAFLLLARVSSSLEKP